jgi:hypothetical protein
MSAEAREDSLQRDVRPKRDAAGASAKTYDPGDASTNVPQVQPERPTADARVLPPFGAIDAARPMALRETRPARPPCMPALWSFMITDRATRCARPVNSGQIE